MSTVTLFTMEWSAGDDLLVVGEVFLLCSAACVGRGGIGGLEYFTFSYTWSLKSSDFEDTGRVLCGDL